MTPPTTTCLPPSADEVDDSPIEQVRLTVPITDDTTLPCLTFRTWVLGLASCAFLSCMNQFFSYRQNPLYLTSVSAQIVTLPLGKFMAATLPTKPIRIPMTKWSFSLNPGPFNTKEHVLITIFASCGSLGVTGISIVTIVKAFYHRNLHPMAAMLMILSTQMLGFGWAGLFRKYLVDSPYMWWPGNLVQVSLFRALHEKEVRPRGGNTKLQFFLLVTATSCAYYILPNYLFPSIASLSFVCWIWKDSVSAQQLGSALHGLGIGSFAFDWTTASSFLQSPLATPGFAIVNVLAGFFLTAYIIGPILYWTNTFDAKRFPIFSSNVFDSTGMLYNTSRIIDEKLFKFNQESYDGYSKMYMSIFFVMTYGLSFATLAATLSHVALFHGRSIWQMWKQTKVHGQSGDIHARLMRKYEAVPQWWFYLILVLMLSLAFVAFEGFDRQLQLPYWGILFACGLSFIFTLPIGIITSSTNQLPGLNMISEIIIGYAYPGKPLANMAFKTYGFASMIQAIVFLGDFKLGHYMKIPPKSMFIVQLVGTVVSSSVYFTVAWWLLTNVDNICDHSRLPQGSPWTCPGDEVNYNASIIWGVVGPRRVFGDLGIYSNMNWLFLVGLVAPVPVWFFSKKYPEKEWIKLINMPILFGATMWMPPARAVNFITWGVVGLFFNFYVYKRYKGWWARHTYILSAGLDVGVAFMAILAYFTLQNKSIYGVNWWGIDLDDHCPLASCPTASGVAVDGCPVF